MLNEIRDKIVNDFFAGKINTDDVCYYISSRYIKEAIDRDLVWRKEFEKNKEKIYDSINTKSVKVKDVDVSEEESDKPREVKRSVVDDFKKIHEKIKRIMDDIVAIYSLYGERLEESTKEAEYSKMILEDISNYVNDINKKLDFCNGISYDIYNELIRDLDKAHSFVIFIKD